MSVYIFCDRLHACRFSLVRIIKVDIVMLSESTQCLTLNRSPYFNYMKKKKYLGIIIGLEI